MDRTKDAERLRKLYEARVPPSMSQAEFGQLFDIGTQGMVSQYLTGHRPLNVEAAAKFARGLGCTIADISPDMARRLRVDVFPVLGRVTVKAMLALMIGIPPSLPSPAEAAPDTRASHVYYVKRRWAFLAAKVRAIAETLRSVAYKSHARASKATG